MWALGGHLGAAVSALVDGQLDEESAEQAWLHVAECAQCRARVQRETWLKNKLACMGGNEPSARLLGSLYELEPDDREAVEAWAAVDAIERDGRTRRRVGLVLAGAGSVSVAVFGLTALSGVLPSSPAGGPAASLSRGANASSPSPAVVAPVANVHGRLPGWTATEGAGVLRAREATPRR